MRLQSCLVLSLLGLYVPFVAGCAGSSNNNSSTPPVVYPTVSSVTPASVAAGAAATTLTVNGTNFTGSTTVQVGGVAEPTSYVSGTQVTATLPAAQLASGAQLSVIALNGTATSGSGTPVNFTVTNPSPTVTGLVPSVFMTGAASTTLSVTGTGFVPTTVVNVNGSARSTTFVSATQVNTILTATDLATAASLNVTAVNATPGGGTSAASAVVVNNPVPTAISVRPTVVVSGTATPATITLTGTNFVPTTVVQVGGSNRPTTYVNSTQLTFQVTAADMATAGSLAVVAVTPAPGGGSSGVAHLAVAAATPTPVLTAVSPTQVVVGSTGLSITVQGSNLNQYCTLQWNGTALTTTSYYGSGLYATVPAAQLTSVGAYSVTANCLTAPAVSNALTVNVTNPPPPTLTNLSPVAAPINTAATITLNGTGFTQASTVTLDGATVTSTFVSANTLTVALAATSLSLPGTHSFTVTTPAPGGGTSSALTFTSYIAIANNNMVYNPVNGLFYVSVPSSAGAPFGNSVVSVDPATGALGTPINVGSEPNRMAVTADGKYLWVGLDGGSAIRKVDLTAGTAGLQFTLGNNSGIYANPVTAQALAALPGATDSVIVSTGGSYATPVIYDAGVLRGTPSTSYFASASTALQVDASKGEIYAAGPSSYSTYTWGTTGVTLKATSTTSASYTGYGYDEFQLAGGRAYTDPGGVYDAESGSLLGTLYSSGTTTASGTTAVDTSLGRVFKLDSATTFSGDTPTQIQIFNTSDFNLTSSAAIPVNVVFGTTSYGYTNATRLTRWGTNGLAFRTTAGVFSLRSNLVKDLSTTSADVGVTVATGGGSTTGSTTTFTATVTNSGPAAATNVALTAVAPSSGTLLSVTSTAGSCSTTNGVSCDLGTLANGASATVTFSVQQLTSGSSTLAVQVSGSENDPVATNNHASASVTVTGSAYASAPVVSSISPATITTGASDTTVTVAGTGFTSGSTVMMDGTALTTSYTSGSTLTATVPAAKLANLGWGTITVTTAAPGGGTSNAVPLTVMSVVTVGLNHILYDPYSRKLMASVGSGSSTVTGNSIVAITPETATLGATVPIGSQPNSIALTSDGQVLYTILSGSQSVARFNMLTQSVDFTYAVPSNPSFDGGITLRGISAQPGTENTIALDIASFTGNAIYDFDPVAKTAAIRGAASGPYSGSCIHFLDATNLLAFDLDTSGGTLDHYKVGAAGLKYYDYSQFSESTLNHFGCFKLDGGLAYSVNGGVADPAPTTAVQRGVFQLPTTYGSGLGNVAPDTSLGRTFFAVSAASSSYFGNLDSIEAFDNRTYLAAGLTPLPFATVEGTSASYSVTDLVRWGQDGLAVLTSTGHLYLLRGPAVVPQLLNSNSAAVLSASSSSTLAVGSGNTMLTLTGSNFVPGVAVTWNGSYRTTTIVDATHVTVAIPAGDLASAGSGSLVATNPGASASGTLTVTVQ